MSKDLQQGWLNFCLNYIEGKVIKKEHYEEHSLLSLQWLVVAIKYFNGCCSTFNLEGGVGCYQNDKDFVIYCDRPLRWVTFFFPFWYYVLDQIIAIGRNRPSGRQPPQAGSDQLPLPAVISTQGRLCHIISNHIIISQWCSTYQSHAFERAIDAKKLRVIGKLSPEWEFQFMDSLGKSLKEELQNV